MSENNLSELAKRYLGIDAKIIDWTEVDLDTLCFQQVLVLESSCQYGKKGDEIIVDYTFVKGLIEIYNEKYDQIDTIKIIGEKKSEQ